ncbi:MAG TPA: hypothetical protein VGQ36_09400 [Thermoanaerobaculia bacterium]|jgi:hypothetical protein|nr:hypothetical protein [Thermoanaerobaculia bacterium]
MAFGFDRLTDYFIAVAALGAANDPEKLIAIAALLGLHDGAAKPQPVLQTPIKPTIELTPIKPETKPPATAKQPPEPARPASRQPTRIQHTVTRRPPRAEPPEWLEHVKALPPPRAVVVPPPAPAPLFAPRWSRAILSTAMSKDVATNTVDVEAMVDAIARGMVLRRVPRRIVPTLSHGVQLLVDRGPSSPPFLKDQDLLVQQIQVVAGNDRVQVLRFDPSRGFIAGKGPRTRWESYFDLLPPLPAMTIVVISDLGIARVPHESNAREPQWRDFLARLHSRGHRVIVFVPFAPARWPRLPRGLAHLVPWDRRTSVQLVRKIVGHRRRRMVIG